MIALILFLAIAINTAVLTYISYNRYKQAILSKAVSVGETVTTDIGKVLAFGMSLENIEGLNEKLRGIIEDKTIGYSMIMNKEGKVLFHSDEKDIGSVFKDSVTEQAISANETLVQEWEDFYDISSPLVDAEGKIAGILRIGVKASVINKELYKLLAWAAGIAVTSFLIFVAIIYLSISRFITDPIMEMEKVAAKVSSGDLTEKVEVVGKDEIASLSGAINSITINLRDMLLKIKDLSKNVSEVTSNITESPASVLKIADLQKNAIEDNARYITEMNSSISAISVSSQSLGESAENASAALEQMIKSISNIAENTNLFNTTSQEAAASIEEMIASIKETAKIIETLAASSEEIGSSFAEINTTVKEIEHSAEESVKLAEKVSIEASEKGSKSINIAIEGMGDIKESVNEIAETINRLEKRSEEIGSILNVIDEVASQTSLLALNAAILAAQAGEHGKSFAVVADEIKMLAERTSASTKEIAELINTVQAETRASVDISNKGIKTVEKGVNLVKEVSNALASILESSKTSTDMSKTIKRATAEEANVIMKTIESVKQMTAQIETIARATKEQSRGSNLILEATERIKSGSEQIKRSTEEQFAGSKQMKSVSENVSDQAGHITEAINSQKQKSEKIVSNMEKIQKTTADLIASAEEMDRSINALRDNANTLLIEIQKFKV